MKFKNFDIADVFGPDEIEQAKGYVGMLGYFEDELDDLDNVITCFPEQIYKLVRIKQAYSNNKYVMGSCSFKYFLPLRKVKSKEYLCDFKAEPTEKDINYRPCKSLKEVMDLLDKEKHGDNLVGTIIYIRYKPSMTTETAMITKVRRYGNGTYQLIFGNVGYSFADLFNSIEILLNGRYQPFGVEVKDE